MDAFTHLLEAEFEPLSAVKQALSAGDLRSATANMEHEPSEAQKDAGNYKKAHVNWKGLAITIETAKGKYRRGVGKDGKPWATLMRDAYGYVKQTESEADGDHIDIFLCEDDLDSEIAFIVNQVDPSTGKFDEHKVVLGVTNERDARAAYLSNYEPGWRGLGSVAAVTLDQFKWWLEHADTSKEVKGGRIAALENRRLKKAAEDFQAVNAAAKEKAQSSTLPHVRDGYIPCRCGERYYAMPETERCPECDAPLGMRLRGKSAGDYQPTLYLVKRAKDEDDSPFTIAVDLDGTLAEKQEPFDPETIGEPRRKAIDWVKAFHEAGARIILWTVRGDTDLVGDWLDEHEVPYDYINTNPNQPADASCKVLADLYWDDRAVDATDPDETGPEVLRRIQADAPQASGDTHVTVTIHKYLVVPADALLDLLEGAEEDDD